MIFLGLNIYNFYKLHKSRQYNLKDCIKIELINVL